MNGKYCWSVLVLVMCLSHGQESHAQMFALGTDMSIGGYGLNPDEAHPHGLGTKAFSGGMSFYAILGRFVRVGGGMLMLSPSDSQSFDVQVVDQNGDESTATASASIAGLFAEVGLSIPFMDKVRGELHLGTMYTSAGRSVADCLDCPNESFDISGGTFVKARLVYRVRRPITLSAEYQRFLKQDGITSGFLFSIGSQWQLKIRAKKNTP